MGRIVKATDKTFNEIVRKGISIIDFWAEWCGPCKMVEPVLDEIAKEYDVQIVKLNVDEEGQTAMDFGIRSIPTLVMMKDGVILDKIIGAVPKKLIVDKLTPML